MILGWMCQYTWTQRSSKVRLVNVIIVEIKGVILHCSIAYSFVKQVEIPETGVRLYTQGR